MKYINAVKPVIRLDFRECVAIKIAPEFAVRLFRIGAVSVRSFRRKKVHVALFQSIFFSVDRKLTFSLSHEFDHIIVGTFTGDKIIFVGIGDSDRFDVERKFHVALEFVFLFKVQISVNDILERVDLSDIFLRHNSLLTKSGFTNPHLLSANYLFIKK